MFTASPFPLRQVIRAHPLPSALRGLLESSEFPAAQGSSTAVHAIPPLHRYTETRAEANRALIRLKRTGKQEKATTTVEDSAMADASDSKLSELETDNEQ